MTYAILFLVISANILIAPNLSIKFRTILAAIYLILAIAVLVLSLVAKG